MLRDPGTWQICALATACLLAFSGFLQFSELINLRPYDFKISKEMMTIKIWHSKTDQWRQGDKVLVARTAKTCPVAMLECYMRVTGMACLGKMNASSFVRYKQPRKARHLENQAR